VQRVSTVLRSPTWLLSLATLGVLLSSRALPATAEYRIDPARTLVSFEVRYLGIARQRGTFNGAHGAVALDAGTGRGHVDIVIDARSLEAASHAMEDFLRGRDLLNVEHYPEIRYRAERVVFAAGTPQRIEGELTLRGVKRSVPLRVTHYDCARSDDALRERCTMDATATFSRSAFGMTSYRTLTSDEVTLAIQAEGVR
jgi:polyisoprenoid-binding protein YceI